MFDENVHELYPMAELEGGGGLYWALEYKVISIANFWCHNLLVNHPLSTTKPTSVPSINIKANPCGVVYVWHIGHVGCYMYMWHIGRWGVTCICATSDK